MLIFRQIHFRIITEAILLKMDGLMVLGLLPQAQELQMFALKQYGVIQMDMIVVIR